MGGLLIRIVTAPIALLVDTCTYLVSALFLRSIDAVEPKLEDGRASSLWLDIREGLATITRRPVLRSLAGCAGTIEFFNSALEAILILYILDQLDIGPGLLGLIFSIGGLGFLAGPVIVSRLDGRVSPRLALVVGILVLGISDLLIPLAGGPHFVVIAILIVAQFFFGVGVSTFSIVRVSTQQAATPDEFQGRTHATMVVLFGSGALFGGLLGGAVAEVIGVRMTLVIAAVGELATVLWVLGIPGETPADEASTSN